MKKRIVSALCVVLMICLMSMTAYAVEFIDVSRTGSVSVAMTYSGEAVSGGSLTAYRVAEVEIINGADCSFTYTLAYAECEADISDLSKADLAAQLVLYTEDKAVSGTKLMIDENGKVVFDGLKLGLYLFVQEDAAPGFSAVSPFIVSVPGRDGEGYVYDVEATPKVGGMPEPVETTPEPDDTTPPEEETTAPGDEPPKLPQTGQNKWPVPVLGVGGLAFVILGVYFVTSSKGRKNEN